MAPLTQFAKITADAVTATETTSSVPCTYHGFSFRETAGASATITIYDNTSAAGTILEPIQLAAGESAREFYVGGIAASVGLHVVVSGTVVGSVRKSRGI